MKQYQVSKTDFFNWLNNLRSEYEVLAPLREENNYNWGIWDGLNLPDNMYQNTLKPPKDLFFPQHEVLLKYRKVKGAKPVIEKQDFPKEKRILFAIRPCDAQSLIILDKVFLSPEYKDPFYQFRRENTVIISLICNEPGQGCFCSKLFSLEGSDLALVDLGDKYLVEVVSTKGEYIFQNVVFSDVDSSLKVRIQELQGKVSQEIASSDLTEKLDPLFNSQLWEELQEKCLNCGVCSFLCPTCHCFDITDDHQGQKIRNWDSCMFSGFTKQASGHNPRPSGTERLRQRVMHKFKYFPEKYGFFACVGCGRCVEKCPVNLDLRQVLMKIKGVI